MWYASEPGSKMSETNSTLSAFEISSCKVKTFISFPFFVFNRLHLLAFAFSLPLRSD